DSVLINNAGLLNYNDYTSRLNKAIPFLRQNTEILYQASFVNYLNGISQVLTGYGFSGCFIDSNLIHSYDPNDLRPAFYYYLAGVTDSFGLKGSYAGSVFPFGGLATDEMYLIRAECRARSG